MSLDLKPTAIGGVFLIGAATVEDTRGSFTRLYAPRAFHDRGLEIPLTLTARATNRHALTLRGMHFQASPDEETKLVTCLRGRVFDVVADLRAGSPTWGRWFGCTLDASKADSLYIPAGCAHGYLTLTDDATVLYQMSDTYRPGSERGIRWNDPTLGIAWPAEPRVISDRDRALPALTPQEVA